MSSLIALASLLLCLPGFVAAQANCADLQNCAPLNHSITAPLSMTGTFALCNGQSYSTSAYTCYSGQLCPVIEGTATAQCGTSCYLPYLYQCVGGSLVPIFGVAVNTAESTTSTFVPTVSVAPSTIVVPAMNSTLVTSTMTALAVNSTTPVVVVTTSKNTTSVAIVTTTSSSTITSTSTSTSTSSAPPSSSSAPPSSSSSKALAAATGTPHGMIFAKVVIPGAMALGLVL